MNTLPPAPDPENALSMAFAQIQGDILALRAIAHVLLRSHPEPAVLATLLAAELDRLNKHWEKFPDPSRYQAEGRLEELIGLLQNAPSR